MNDEHWPPKAYFKDQPSHAEAKTHLLHILLKLAGYNLISDLGISGVLIYQSKAGKFLSIKRW